jgi:hypothetical protein
VSAPAEVRADVAWRVGRARLLMEQAYALAEEAQGLLRDITGPGACEAYQAVRAAREPLYQQILALVAAEDPDALDAWGLDADGLAKLRGEEPWVPRWHDPAAGGDR